MEFYSERCADWLDNNPSMVLPLWAHISTGMIEAQSTAGQEDTADACTREPLNTRPLSLKNVDVKLVAAALNFCQMCSHWACALGCDVQTSEFRLFMCDLLV